MKALLLKSFIVLGAVSMAVMASSYFIYEKNSFLDAKELSSYLWYRTIFKTHIVSGVVAIVTGAFQFIKSPIKQRISLHKYIGKVYVASIFISSFCGLVAAQFATGGLVSRIGFSVLSILWFYFTYLAYKQARAGNIPAHKIWMYRSYALTFSSLTLRLFLLLVLFSPAPFLIVYQFASWACWITNLVVCEWILHLKKQGARSEFSTV